MKNKLSVLLACVSFLSTLSAHTNEDNCCGCISETEFQRPQVASGSCKWVNDYFTYVPDFPIPGIIFTCYPNLLENPEAFRQVIQIFADRYRGCNLDAIVGLDARGFVFGAPLAYELGVPFVMMRKAGKLPRETESINYALEYGTNTFEIEKASINPDDRVLIIDDLLATGGTAEAACQLVRKLGGIVVETAFLVDIPFLNGKDNVSAPVFTLTSVD